MDLRKGSGWGLEKMDKVELRNLYLCEEHNHKLQQIFFQATSFISPVSS